MGCCVEALCRLRTMCGRHWQGWLPRVFCVLRKPCKCTSLRLGRVCNGGYLHTVRQVCFHQY